MDETNNHKQIFLNMPTAIVVVGVLIAATLYVNKNGLKLPQRKIAEAPVANQAAKNSQSDANRRKPEDVPKISPKDHIKGNRDAKIAMIEYSDLECPYCKAFHPIAQKVVDKYKGQVMWVYRHFPISQLHSKSPKEAEATECANELGGNKKFWEYTDKIFAATPSNNGLDPVKLPEIAKDVGLDKNKFQACLDSGRYTEHVQNDFKGGAAAGVAGTPSSILLNVKTGAAELVPGAVPFETLKQMIDKML